MTLENCQMLMMASTGILFCSISLAIIVHIILYLKDNY